MAIKACRETELSRLQPPGFLYALCTLTLYTLYHTGKNILLYSLLGLASEEHTYRILSDPDEPLAFSVGKATRDMLVDVK